MASGIFGARTLRRAGLAGALVSGALLAATGFHGLAAVDDTLEASGPKPTRSFTGDDGRRDRDCPKKHERRPGRPAV